MKRMIFILIILAGIFNVTPYLWADSDTAYMESSSYSTDYTLLVDYYANQEITEKDFKEKIIGNASAINKEVSILSKVNRAMAGYIVPGKDATLGILYGNIASPKLSEKSQIKPENMGYALIVPFFDKSLTDLNKELLSALNRNSRSLIKPKYVIAKIIASGGGSGGGGGGGKRRRKHKK